MAFLQPLVFIMRILKTLFELAALFWSGWPYSPIGAFHAPRGHFECAPLAELRADSLSPPLGDFELSSERPANVNSGGRSRVRKI